MSGDGLFLILTATNLSSRVLKLSEPFVSCGNGVEQRLNLCKSTSWMLFTKVISR